MTTNEAREKILDLMCKLGQRYLKDGDDDEAIRWLTAAADLSSDNMHRKISHEMYEIGNRYLGEFYLDDGKVDEAFRWLKAAANPGSDDANCELGDMYYCGRGVEKNIAKAVEFYKTAADLGNYSACLSLFKMYRDGESDIKPDINHYGDDEVRFELGCMYLYGDGVERDIYKAACWFANMNDYVSETDGFYDALFDLAECYRTGDGTKKDMDMAVAWYEHIINYCDFHDKTLFTLAEIYFKGDGVERNIDRAIELYTRAADNDNLKAAYKLATIYRDGAGVDKDLDTAQKFLDKTISGLLEDFGG